MAPNGAPASETLLRNLKTTNDKSRQSTTSCPRCISCTHWMLMESGYTLSTRFAASCRQRTPCLPLLTLALCCRSKRARSQSQHIQPDSVPTTNTRVRLPCLSAIRTRGKADGGHHTGHRVTLKKRYGLLLTQNSEWTTVRTGRRDADWKQRMRRS